MYCRRALSSLRSFLYELADLGYPLSLDAYLLGQLPATGEQLHALGCLPSLVHFSASISSSWQRSAYLGVPPLHFSIIPPLVRSRPLHWLEHCSAYLLRYAGSAVLRPLLLLCRAYPPPSTSAGTSLKRMLATSALESGSSPLCLSYFNRTDQAPGFSSISALHLSRLPYAKAGANSCVRP